MSGSVNKCIIVGNVVAAPDVRTFGNGGKVVNMRVATNETWKKDGERKERTEFHNVSIMNENLAKIAEQYIRKGSMVYIEGQLQTRKWQDQSGADRYTTEIVLRPFHGELTLLGGKPDGERDDYQPQQSQPSGGFYQPRQPKQSSGGFGGGLGDMDDAVPFAPEWR